MDSKNNSASHAFLFPVGGRKGQTPNAVSPNAGFNAEFHEISSHGMDRALAMQKVSLAATVRIQLDVIETYKNASWCTPELSEWLDGMAQAFSSCADLQLNLFALMGTHVSSALAELPGMNPQMTEKVIERTTEIALGSRKTV